MAAVLAPSGLTTGVVGDDFRPAPSQPVSSRGFVPCSSNPPHIVTLPPPPPPPPTPLLHTLPGTVTHTTPCRDARDYFFITKYLHFIDFFSLLESPFSLIVFYSIKIKCNDMLSMQLYFLGNIYLMYYVQ